MKIIVFSGFLGAGKTTLIKKLIKESFKGQKLVLIENEFGEIGVDGGFLKECGVQINEINSGCICCSLVGDFTKALNQVVSEYSPEVMFIEPSGVGKLSDVFKAVKQALPDSKPVGVTVVNASKAKMYNKNFGEFFKNQIQYADTVVLSHTAKANEKQIKDAEAIVRDLNQCCALIATDWDKISGDQIVQAIKGTASVENLVEQLLRQTESEHEHHHDHDDGHEHHHHDGECSCGHHHADEVFVSFGRETTNKYNEEQIRFALEQFDEMQAGTVLRAKGIVESVDGRWIHFDYIPGDCDIRYSTAEVIGKICVIGCNLNEEKIEQLFKL